MYRMAIIGSGPGGLSAACRAAEMGDSHILLEAQPQLCNTIFRYQKRKNAIALTGRNKVHIVNRKGEFSRAKEGNNAAILQAIERGAVKCQYHSAIECVEELAPGHASGRRLLLKLNSKEGPAQIPCDRII